MPKHNLLYMVQSILSDMDAEEVNSIEDTSEAGQVARIIRDTFYNITNNRNFPEHNQFVKFTAASDSNFPTHFEYGDDVRNVTKVWYDTSDDSADPNYTEIFWVDHLEFVERTDSRTSFVLVDDKKAGTKLKIGNDKRPTFYTSFDDQWVVMDSYDATIDSTLQESKIRAYATVEPTFTLSDSFVPDLDANIFPLLLNESKSVAMSLLVGGSDPKVDQAARRQRYRNQNQRYKTKQPQGYSSYGRNG